MKALIDLQSTVSNVTSYAYQPIADKTIPVYEEISNSARICQIEENQFEVNPTALLWVDCNSSVTCNDYYYDTSDSTIKPIVNADRPA